MAWLYGIGGNYIVALRGCGAALGAFYGVGQDRFFQTDPAGG